MRFIVLTNTDGKRVRYNAANIVSYYEWVKTTCLTLHGGGKEYVRQTPEEIDTLLITNGILVHE